MDNEFVPSDPVLPSAGFTLIKPEIDNSVYAPIISDEIQQESPIQAVQDENQQPEEENDDEEDDGYGQNGRKPIHVTAQLNTLEEQRELFLWKYSDVPREAVNEMLKDFRRYDFGNKGGLDYYELMLLMEHRGCVMTATEIMGMVGNEYHDSSTRLSFIEWLCAYYLKDYQDMFVYVDDASRRAALAEAMKYTEEARRLEEEIEKARQLKEMRASIRAAALERESKLTGVAGMKAFFARKAEDCGFDSTKSNEEQIKEEASRRKALREAKLKLNQAILAANSSEKDITVLAREIQLAAKRAIEEEAAAAKRKEEEEKLQRSARKAALNAKWGGVASPAPKLAPLTPGRNSICPTSPIRSTPGNKLFPTTPSRSIPFPNAVV